MQNVVVRALTHAAPGCNAIVEECFPAAAMTDPHAFFDAVGEGEKFQRNVAEMMDSRGRSIPPHPKTLAPSRTSAANVRRHADKLPADASPRYRATFVAGCRPLQPPIASATRTCPRPYCESDACRRR
ncbi:hypothetical protein EMIT0111MI5_10172 [Burkholderia sp. IT-111MI5]